MRINYELEERPEKIEFPDELVFGRNFTTHCFEMDYDPSLGGWHNARIKKLTNLSLSPASLVLHYGQSIFEGLKAYKQVDGKIVLFRADQNIERLNRSARRMCIPEVNENELLESLIELIKIEKDWIPTKPGHSLYIRPVVFGTDPTVGVRPSNTYKLIIMLSPVGPYYPEGFKPIPIMATDKYVRAVRKGVGDCKTAGNYGASLAAQKEALAEGYSQVLWLDALEQKYIEEVGTMNIFVQFKDEVATAPLAGSILPGITRKSVIKILKDWGYNIQERSVSIYEAIERYNDGTLVEIFGAGTAAVISSIGKLKFHDTILQFNEEKPGELGQKLYDYLTGIQFGTVEDKYGWLIPVE